MKIEVQDLISRVVNKRVQQEGGNNNRGGGRGQGGKGTRGRGTGRNVGSEGYRDGYDQEFFRREERCAWVIIETFHVRQRPA